MILSNDSREITAHIIKVRPSFENSRQHTKKDEGSFRSPPKVNVFSSVAGGYNSRDYLLQWSWGSGLCIPNAQLRCLQMHTVSERPLCTQRWLVEIFVK